MIKLARFASDEKLAFIDNRQFDGNIFECIDQAYKYIVSALNFNAVIEGIERKEEPEIPLEAIREIVVNSFAHMRVTAGDCNEITISPHEVRIYNPGTIALNSDPADFASGKLGSKLRNPLIALTLYKNKMIETFGTGFRRVFDLCSRQGVKYEYRNEGSGFSFTFIRRETIMLQRYTALRDEAADEIIDGLSLTENAVYQLVKGEKIVYSVKQAASVLHKSAITVQRALSSLTAAGYIERVGSRKSGYWKIKL